MRKGTIHPNLTYLVKHILQSSSPENIDLNYAWFTPNTEEDIRENPTHDPRVTPENNNNTLTLSQSIPHVHEIMDSKGTPISEVIEHPYSEGV